MWYYVVMVACAHSIEAYKAAVVHFYPREGTTPTHTIHKNIQQYQKLANKAKINNADIVVFPEYGLVSTEALAAPEEYAVDGTEDDVVRRLGTIARDNKIYLVVNLFEKQNEDNKTNYYNTNLVFARNGTIILKYHKIHLFNEGFLTPGSPDQEPIFTTDFGVTFGIFTCFDILFVNPSQTVLAGTNVTDVIFVTGWLPSYISLSVQQGYSISNKVNLLAANYGEYNGRSGTGIYLADGQKSKMLVNRKRSKLLILEIPRNIKKNENVTSTKVFGQEAELEALGLETRARQIELNDVDLRKRHTTHKICKNDFCCSFDITIDESQKKSEDIYRTLLYRDTGYFTKTKSDFSICALLACTDASSFRSCGAMTSVTTVFKKVTVRGNFPGNNSTFYRPFTLSQHRAPLQHFRYSTDQTEAQLSTKKLKDVLVFGIFARTDTKSDVIIGNDMRNVGSFIILLWGRTYPFFL